MENINMEVDSDFDPPPAIELRDVSKTFGNVQANKNISMKIEKGSIHGIVGENGAGKSTLMNILYGLHAADTGDILVNGQKTNIRSSADSIALGIGMVHQHFMLIPNFTVLENVMVGNEGGFLLGGGEEEAVRTLRHLGTEYGMDVDPYALIEDLPVGIRQRVEIIKAIKSGAEILILDEPTGVLTPQEAEGLFTILRVLRDRGVSVLLITHKLAEIMTITDAVSVIRDGEIVGHRKTSDTTTEELAELMVGREVSLHVERGASEAGETRLSVSNLGHSSLSGIKQLTGITFDLHAGEILGVAGVAGNGQTELLEILSGMRVPDEGKFSVLGTEVTPNKHSNPKLMRKLGIGHIPEDRHLHGLVLDFEAQENFVFGFHDAGQFYSGSFLNQKFITDHSSDLMGKFDVRPTNPKTKAKNFSGGNQQKIVIAREINEVPKLLIIGQPTRGVDIGAIEFIHKQIIDLRDQGCAILLVSVELEEILGLSDRIMVMNAGEQMGILDRDEADERTLGLMMAGITGSNAA